MSNLHSTCSKKQSSKKVKEKQRVEKLTEGLITLDLPMPRCVISYYNKHCKESMGSGCVFGDVITERNGLLLQRIFAFQMFDDTENYARNTVTEVARRYEGGKFVVCNVHQSWGLFPKWYVPNSEANTRDCSTSGWNVDDANIWEKGKYYFQKPYYHINLVDMNKKFPYCAFIEYNKKTGNTDLFEYLVSYRKNPQIEMLVKTGYGHFAKHYKQLYKGKNFEQIFGVSKRFAEDFKSPSISIKDLQLLRKHPEFQSIDELKTYEYVLKKIQGSAYYHGYKNIQEQDIKYIIHNPYFMDTENKKFNYYGNLSIYDDYLRFAEALGYPLNEKKWRYPKDLVKAHDEAKDKVDQQKDVLTKKGFQIMNEKAQKYAYSNDEFTVVPAKTAQDLIEESKQMSNCVRTYVNKVVNKESMILFVRRNNALDKSWVTMELLPDKKGSFKKISQVYAKNNSRPDDETSAFVIEWRDKFKLNGGEWLERRI